MPEAPVRGDAEASSVAGAAVPSATATSTKLAEATGDQPPVFGVPAVCLLSQLLSKSRSSRKEPTEGHAERRLKEKGFTTVFEYDCSPSSAFGKSNH